MIPHRSPSRDTAENGVSSRVEACRKRLRLIRGNHKGPLEEVEPVGILVAFNVQGSTEVSQSPEVIEMKAERMDEAGIT
jgi:hypothetical protein